MKRLLILLTFALSTLLCRAGQFTEMVAFGDSLTDMGNRWIKPDLPEEKLKQTWVKQLAGPSMLNIPKFTPSGMNKYFGGTNYAMGGATTEFTAAMNSDRNKGQNLTQQVSKRYLNPAFNTDGVKPDALHVIRIGTNDIMLASTAPLQIATLWSGLPAVGVEVAKSTEGQIQALASAGVKNVLWGNLSDTAQFPSIIARVKALAGSQAPVILTALTKATIAYNTEMDAAIARLEKANPNLKIIKLDLFTKFTEIAADPTKYGFADVTSGANDAKHLFSADGLHPTYQGHKMLAQYAYEVLTATPQVTAHQP